MKLLVVTGRLFYSAIFIMTVMTHFSSKGIEHAASAGVPGAQWLVPVSGFFAVAGGLSILLGYQAKAGAWLLIIFLVPVTFYMHAFWNVTDPMQQHMQMANFMKNVALIGAALLISYFGSGPYSLDEFIQAKGGES